MTLISLIKYPIIRPVSKSVQFPCEIVRLGDSYMQVTSRGRPEIQWSIIFGTLSLDTKIEMLDQFRFFDTTVEYLVQPLVNQQPFKIRLQDYTENLRTHRTWDIEIKGLQI